MLEHFFSFQTFYILHLVSLLRLHSSIIPGCSLRRYSMASAHIIFDVLTNNCNLAKKRVQTSKKLGKKTLSTLEKFLWVTKIYPYVPDI